MNRRSRWLLIAGFGALLAAGCSSPTDQTAGNVLADPPAPGGDGTVSRMPLDGAPLGIAVAREAFAYITQPDHGFSPGRLARVDLNARTVRATIAVGMVPSL